MIQILNCEPEGYSAKARAILESVAKVTEIPLDRDGLISRIAEFDVLIVRLRHQIDVEVMDAAPSLRVISSATTGIDHIDLAAAKERGIDVLTLRGEQVFLDSIVATAEHTWALLLSLIRKIPAAADSVRSGEWNRDRFKGTELRGKRLGILGLGRLGTKVANFGNAFGMEVLAYDPYRSAWPNDVTRCSSLDELMHASDVLSIHVPLNDETEGMIGKQQLSKMPKGALVVNTSRAAIGDENAMVDSLESGQLAGIAVDVISEERNEVARRSGPLVSYLSENWGSGKVVITPHIGGATYESMESTEIFMAEKLVRFLEHTRGSANE